MSKKTIEHAASVLKEIKAEVNNGVIKGHEIPVLCNMETGRETPWEENIKNVDALPEAINMSKTTYCGECEKFLYEDTYGYGVCDKTKEGCLCSDACHLTNGKP